MQEAVATTEAANERYREAIQVAEELVEVLAEEQAKYENVDAAGNLLEPLAQDLIADLEARRTSLVEEAQAAQ
jgi:hypothetical protein